MCGLIGVCFALQLTLERELPQPYAIQCSAESSSNAGTPARVSVQLHSGADLSGGIYPPGFFHMSRGTAPAPVALQLYAAASLLRGFAARAVALAGSGGEITDFFSKTFIDDLQSFRKRFIVAEF